MSCRLERQDELRLIHECCSGLDDSSFLNKFGELAQVHVKNRRNELRALYGYFERSTEGEVNFKPSSTYEARTIIRNKRTIWIWRRMLNIFLTPAPWNSIPM
jgi:hypothetical protein